MIYSLRVDGDPAPKGSMKCIGGRGKVKHQLIEDDSTGARRVWRKRLTSAAAGLAGLLPDQGEGGVIVGVVALVKRPPSAPRSRTLPTTRSAGDADKHARMTLDALDDAGVYVDDSRVVLEMAGKAYADHGPTGAVIYVGSVGDDPHAILSAMLRTAPALVGVAKLVEP